MNRFQWSKGDIVLAGRNKIEDGKSKKKDLEKENIKDITRKVLKQILNNINQKKT